MISRIYVDNYRSLVNFTLDLQPMNLLMGPNGSGKSTVLEVVRVLRDFISDRLPIDQAFAAATLTRWETRKTQTFELSEAHADGEYRYRLEIEHNDQRQRYVRSEQVTLNGSPLYQSEKGRVQLFRGDGSMGPRLKLGSSVSGFGALAESDDNRRARDFRDRIRNLLVVKLNPALMKAEADREDSRLELDLSNFVAWYRWLSQEHQDVALDLIQELRRNIEGFQAFSLRGEERKVLHVKFGTNGGETQFYRFDEISDGQRALIALSVLKEAAGRLGFILWLDEPENFLALREIQPWLHQLQDAIEAKAVPQAILISHHPVLVNHLARSNGIWMDRGVEQPTRARRIELSDLGAAASKGNGGQGLTVAELVERGWLYE